MLPCGDRALLVELPDEATRRAWDAALRVARRSAPLAGAVVEQVPAARTVLVRVHDASQLALVQDALTSIDAGASHAHVATQDDVLVIPVRYDGDDLATVADLFGLSMEGVVSWHTGDLWRLDFAGFSAGFGYLLQDNVIDPRQVPRLESPRVRVPAGSVALAGAWTGIYPTATSGGWQLIGHTEMPMWDAARQPPALLTPGRAIRFEAVR
ncbi:5-oxoprolinase subunit B family protein [Rudaeicoccus suwonensis]|uniref:KipI family sensor histidine kinase inhibitor n=1 Tax=Rudaeicoccus suwonensis TaxID=657409 RepID=A0A561E6N2_9MICO|nr:allophanate hydrolase subunit 1 [Rudaeicoccus suwonensis]TWE11254.1 KipI family sensor histidine kinase inhibitor [Rudaeicoccus suwonensis]